MLKRVFRGETLRMAVAAIALSLAVAPTAFAKNGGGFFDNKDKGNDHGNDRAIPNCSRGRDNDRDGGEHGQHLTSCPGNQVLVRIDEKVCPDKPNRPSSIVKRACCQTHGTTYCHPFHPCPPRSRS
jgi:hypothetical protein